MTDHEAMKMALAKLEHLWDIGIDAEYKVELLPEIEALRQALQRPVKSYTNNSPQYATDDRYTKLRNVYTSEECVHEIDKSIHDLRKAAEMALEALCSANPIGHALEDYEYHNKATEALRQALAQPEQEPVAYLDAVDNKTVYVAPNRKSWLDPHEDKEWLQFHYDHCHDTPLYTAPPSNLEKEKESTAQTVDPRLLLGRSNNFTKETENRLCDIERRLAAIETQHAPPSKPAERNENG